MPFQKGNTLGKGRPKKLRRQVKDWIKEHPYAFSEMMDKLYDKGLDGDMESAIYVADRIKGKPKASTEIDLHANQGLRAGDIFAIFKHSKEAEREIDNEIREVINLYFKEHSEVEHPEWYKHLHTKPKITTHYHPLQLSQGVTNGQSVTEGEDQGEGNAELRHGAH